MEARWKVEGLRQEGGGFGDFLFDRALLLCWWGIVWYGGRVRYFHWV